MSFPWCVTSLCHYYWCMGWGQAVRAKLVEVLGDERFLVSKGWSCRGLVPVLMSPAWVLNGKAGMRWFRKPFQFVPALEVVPRIEKRPIEVDESFEAVTEFHRIGIKIITIIQKMQSFFRFSQVCDGVLLEDGPF